MLNHLAIVIFLWLKITVSCLPLENPDPSYAPTIVNCPRDLKNRVGQSVGMDESSYIEERRTNVLPRAYHEYLKNLDAFIASTNGSLTLPSYVRKILSSEDQTELPRLSIAVGGGAYRGAIFAASIMNTLDGRNVSSAGTGIGGLLQTADYITGLSGSAWLVISWADSELVPLYDLVLGSATNSSRRGGWFAEFNLFNPTSIFKVKTFPDWINKIALGLKYWVKVWDQAFQKAFAGFPITVVDLWGRVLSYHFLSGSEQKTDDFFGGNFTQGLNKTLSGFFELPSFKNYSQPYPIVTSLPLSQSNPGDFPSPLNCTQYEISPFEFGSYDKSLSSFIPTKYLGTRMRSGIPIDPERCVRGFDNAGFLMGVSSNLFPAYRILAQAFFNVTVPLKRSPRFVNGVIPNPFLGMGTQDYPERGYEDLQLVDGGFGDEVTPYAPLLVSARKVEIIFAIDGTADWQNYANGSSLIRTAQRVSENPVYKFPQVPLNDSTYTTEGLIHRPTFFGCDESSEVPLVIWLANSSPIDGSIGVTNTTTVQIAYPIEETRAMMNQAIETSLRGFPSQEMITKNKFRDPLWPICLSCAVTDRARVRLGERRDGLCQACFDRYCWKPSK